MCGFICWWIRWSWIVSAACQERESEDQISRREHEEEMKRMRLEVQQCKDFIHMQQQLLQVIYTHNMQYKHRPKIQIDVWWCFLKCVFECLLDKATNTVRSFTATAELTVWWWNSRSAERLLHAGGERATEGGMETLQWAEEELWEGEEEFHWSCYSSGPWGAKETTHHI